MILTWKKLLSTILSAAFIALIVRIFFLEAFRIPTVSMQPTLNPGDVVLVNKASYGIQLPFFSRYVTHWASVKRGDLVVFPLPDDPQRLFVKRVAAVGGDQVSLDEQGRLWINGKVYSDAAWEGVDSPETPTDQTEAKPHQVPEGELFLIGDTPHKGTDSRHWGTVKESTILGKVWVVFSKGWIKPIKNVSFN